MGKIGLNSSFSLFGFLEIIHARIYNNGLPPNGNNAGDKACFA